MERPNQPLFDLQSLTVNFAQIPRNHYLAGIERHENDAEHTLTVALLCWYIFEEVQPNLDLSKVLKYAISHDFPEVYAGDVNTFASPEERQRKLEREALSKQRLANEFSGFADMIDTIDSYDKKDDEESLFVWTVDKMQALIMGELDDWRPYRELGISYKSFVDKYEELLEKSSPHCHEIFADLIEYCKTTYNDKPLKRKKTRFPRIFFNKFGSGEWA